jgi:XTP/dITP diphosphohydrolase
MVIILASNNKGKLVELQSMLAPLGHELVAQGELGIPAAREPFGTFVENALAKARNAALSSGLAAIADDSGICVDALKGAPGVYSARYAKLGIAAVLNHDDQEADKDNNASLLQRMARFEKPEQRSAHFTAVLVALRSATDPEPLIAQGHWHGTIAHESRGEHGFGYDSVFHVPELGCTSAQLTPEQKNRISHRALAMQQLQKLMRERWAA